MQLSSQYIWDLKPQTSSQSWGDLQWLLCLQQTWMFFQNMEHDFAHRILGDASSGGFVLFKGHWLEKEKS